jgi:hypothetical protein
MSFNEAHAGDKPLAPRWMMDANAVNLAPVETGRVRGWLSLGLQPNQEIVVDTSVAIRTR